jgi:two-component system, LytTR family, response regulator
MSTEPVRLLLADDEEPARRLLRTYARRQAGIEIVGECGDGDELLTLLRRLEPEVAILDVRMPGRDVFAVLEEMAGDGLLPFVVFASAYDRYAVRAFELNAVDYLLKPFTEGRFAAAIGRVRERAEDAGRVRQLARDLGPRPERLLVRERGRIVPVAVADILWIAAEGDYSRIHTPGRSYLVSRTLSQLEERLNPDQFLRAHRSAIVRWERIREVVPEGSSRYRLVLDDGTLLLVSRSRAAELRRRLV